jgi:hypothetical protein
MRKVFLCLIALAAMLVIVPSALALTVSLYAPANVGITDFKWELEGTTIHLYENWGALGRGFVAFEGLDLGLDYTVKKHIWNNTGVDWDLFSDELLDPTGQENDRAYDDPIAPWVPAGFSHSNNMDDLFYAYGIPRTSTAFASLLVDEMAGRDFLEYYNGSVLGSGGYEEQSFGLVNYYLENEPFLLAQRPNEHSVVPEPGTLMLIGSGLFGLGIARRRR